MNGIVGVDGVGAEWWAKGRWVFGLVKADHDDRTTEKVALSIRFGLCWLADPERCAGVAFAFPEVKLFRKLVAEQTATFVPEQCRLRHLVRTSRCCCCCWSLGISHGWLGLCGSDGVGRPEGSTEPEMLCVFLSNRLGLNHRRLLRESRFELFHLCAGPSGRPGRSA